ncbi:MAG: hypothetical protein RSH79_06010 [Clostridiales bacterium]
MIEIIDNAIQLCVTMGCGLWAGIYAFRHKSQLFFLLACFYGTFCLGLIYWLLYLVLNGYTPRFFYVSDLSWIAGFLFLLLLNLFIAQPEERGYRSIYAFLVVLVLLLMTWHLCSFGNDINTLIWCLLLTGCGYLSTRGLLFARQHGALKPRLQYIHIAILFVIFAEFILWISSCYFKESTLANPYFWCDFLLTAGLFALMPALLKAVDS